MNVSEKQVRNLLIVYGDQLDHNHPLLENLDSDVDLVWMAEARAEAGKVWSTKSRIALFFAAMRHYAKWLAERDLRVLYHEFSDHSESMAELLARDLKRYRPSRVLVVRPGEWQVLEDLKQACASNGIPLEIAEDPHFFTTPDDFAEWASSRNSIRMEYFYREMRKQKNILMTADGKPVGGEWNYDKENRQSLNAGGLHSIPEIPRFELDSITRKVLASVENEFADHPGDLSEFNWPVTRQQALDALDAFIADRLAQFGDYQDAMWQHQPFLYHSLLSAALNMKLLNPREVIQAAVQAFEEDNAPLNAVEGFVRQILGWREYVRGVYWWKMPAYLNLNTLEADQPLPDFYWTGETPMVCLADSIAQTLRFGYAHHIQRLMVTGLYGLLLGVKPQSMHEWYLAVYVDAIEWVELPNTLGMSQFGDGGLMASKPYVATGKYIQRMSNYCESCRYNPANATGSDACPFTTLYWDFLLRNERKLRHNQRMRMQLKNLERIDADRRAAIRGRAAAIRSAPAAEAPMS